MLSGHCPLDRAENSLEYMRTELLKYYVTKAMNLPTHPFDNLPFYAQVSLGKKTILKTDEDVSTVVRRALFRNHYVDKDLLKEEFCRRVCENVLC